MPGLGSDEMTVLWPNDCIFLSFHYILSTRISNVITFVKEVFWLDAGLDCDEMAVLWPNDRMILSFYCILFIKISNVTTFVREFFWLDV